MNFVTQIFNYMFPSGFDQQIAILAIPLDVLTTRLGIKLEKWDEDGLGVARGAFIRLPSGKVILLREFKYIVEHRGFRETEIIADGQDVATFSVSPLVDEVCVAFDLPPSMIEWTAGDEVRRRSEEIAAMLRARKE